MSNRTLLPDFIGSDALARAAHIARSQAIGTALTAAIRAPFHWVTTVVTQTIRARRGRAGIMPLLSMSDRELKDLGLNRCDVLDAMHLPLSEEPGAFLEGRRGHSTSSWRGLVAKVRGRTPATPVAGPSNLRAA